MTAYPASAPFEFEGVKVFESPDNPRQFVRLTLQGTNDPGVAVTEAEIRALIAWQATQTPPPPAVPKVGDYIRAEYRNTVDSPVAIAEGLVSESRLRGTFEVGDVYVGFPDRPSVGPGFTRLVSWTPANRPTPAWHTPEPGSLWELTVDGHTGDWVAIKRGNGMVFCRVTTDGLVGPEFYGITAGREVTR